MVICFVGPQVLQQLKDKALRRAELTEEDILRSIEERTLARKNKEFSRSDQIRSDLAAKGIALMDVGKDTIWRPCVPAQPESVTGDPKNTPPAEKGQPAKPTDK